MDRLTLILTFISGTAISIALIVAAYAMGYGTWWVMILAILVAFGIAEPSAERVSRALRKGPKGPKPPLGGPGNPDV